MKKDPKFIRKYLRSIKYAEYIYRRMNSKWSLVRRYHIGLVNSVDALDSVERAHKLYVKLKSRGII